MAKLEFDTLDIGLLVLGNMMGWIMVGIGSFDLFGVNFGQTVTTIAGFDLSTAYVLSALSIVGVLLTNDNTEIGDLGTDSIKNLDGYYAFTVVGTLGFMMLWLVSGSFVDFVQSEDLWGVVYVLIVTAGTFVMGWIL